MKKIQIFLKKSGKRYGVNAVGFQGINCHSHISFNQRSNSVNFILALCEYQLFRIENTEAKKILYEIITDDLLDENNTKLYLLKKASEEDYEKIFDEEGNIDPKKLAYQCKKHKINYYKINKTRQKYLESKLYNKRLIELLRNERKLNIVMDNARIHTSKFSTAMYNLLSITPIYLPPYCPFLNPLEDVWKDVKREIYNEDFKNIKELTKKFKKHFDKRVDRITYYEGWVDEFLMR